MKERQITKTSLFRNILRTITLWFCEVVGFMLIVHMNIGVNITEGFSVLLLIFLLSIINALFWPILSKLFLPFLVYTIGFGTFIINGALLWLLSEIVPGITITGYGIILAPLILSFISTALSLLLTLNDETSYYRMVIRNKLPRNIKTYKDYPGIIILELDGLSQEVLEEAIDRGDMPTLKSWIEDGDYTITGWETDYSSQTGSSQAGILHGSNENIPAFRWVEKNQDNKIMVSVRDAAIIEDRISNGKGLLHINGASRTNLFSGDTENVLLTYSKVNEISEFYTKHWYYIFSNSTNFIRMLILLGIDILKELYSQIRHKVLNIQPRISRNWNYLFIRGLMNTFINEINTQTIIGDMLSGEIDVAYTTYLAYDEIAHHSGVRDEDSFGALRNLDNEIKHISMAKDYSKRDYKIVIQSDHGQTNGATFKQRYHETFEEYVRKLLPANMKMYSEMSSKEDRVTDSLKEPITDSKEYIRDKTDKIKVKKDEVIHSVKEHEIIDQLQENKIKDQEKREELKEKVKEHELIEYIQENKIIGQKKREELKEKVKDYDIIPNSEKINAKKDELMNYIHKHRINEDEWSTETAEEAEVIVLGSGNLGLIYFTKIKEQLSYERIKELFPDLIPGLIKHDGIGFVMVNSEELGPLVIGDEGIYYLDEDKFQGKNPLEVFGENAAIPLRRSSKFYNGPDLWVNSFYDPETNEVAAFEELIGSHGGLGGEQSHAFIMHPSEWNLSDKKILGAENLHKALMKQIMEYQPKK